MANLIGTKANQVPVNATWAKLREVLAEVEPGARPAPSSFTDIESELPVLT